MPIFIAYYSNELNMLASYAFNTYYKPENDGSSIMPSLRLLEGGKFFPTQYSPVLVQEYGQIRLKFFKWGLIPPWHKASKIKDQTPTVAVDQVLSNPMLQLPLRNQRCLVPADGYYLKKIVGANKQLHKVIKNNQETFCFAGIYDKWRAEDGTIQHSFAILTQPASGSLQKFHLRMPLIVSKKTEALWISPYTKMALIDQLCQSNTHKAVEIHRVQELIAA